ncbi:transporter substrate-binding domain-containing protein [Helicovermis profundi]|uniref:histidine kinase n=1 Tax=Helicovermis profundi TaxID=3065157 RepID=A0AAU9EMC1_9FIRM|nr:hypothetical protein HLPR_07320 [Clostridia bacterium S502]
MNRKFKIITIFSLLTILFLALLIMSSYAKEISHNNIFTLEEITWLNEHPLIKVAPEHDYAPIEYYKKNEFVGLSRDYLDWISKAYNINFEYVYYNTWTDILNVLKNNEVDLQSAIVKTTDRDKYLSFTEPYANVPSVVLVRKNFDKNLNIDTLFDYKVGLIKDYAVEEYIKATYKPNKLYEYTDIKDSLTDLSLGKIDALVLDLGQASYYIQDMAISNVIITNEVKINFDYKLRFATPKNNKILVSILNKALKTMPNSKKQELLNKWISLGNYSWLSSNLKKILTYLFFIVIVSFSTISIWTVLLKKKVNEKTNELNAELKNSKRISEDLSNLTNHLEELVKERSKSLTVANNKLSISLKELKKKETELVNKNKLLNEQIAVIEETQMQLVESEKLNALSRLVIGVAHELNTPLGNSITTISYLNFIIKKLHDFNHMSRSETDIFEVNEYLESANISTEKALTYLNKAAKIINDFRSIANYNYESSNENIIIDESINNIISMLKHHKNFTNYTFNLNLEANIKLNISQNVLFQILSAIIENAYYHAYNESKSGIIDVILTMNEVSKEVKLVIKDYGNGMPKEIENKIFEPFYTSQRGNRYMGMGLYSVYNIVTGVLHGKILVDSKINEGTTFKIIFNAE